MQTCSDFDGKQFAKLLKHEPGVYRMLDPAGEVLYVGKARDLQKRVASYFLKNTHSPRIANMLQKVASMEVDVTRTEGEALLLENRLIKSLKPKYNILLRDDKSFPSIFLSSKSPWPGLAYHRGSRKQAGEYYGPFPSVKSVRHTLDMLQKLFKLRQCEDSQLNNRTRACLQYQIGRCLGPCVGLSSEQHYSEAVRHTRLFLQGKSLEVIEELIQQMEKQSQALAFEQAAHTRDLIASMKTIQHQQFVDGVRGDLDVLGAYIEAGVACVHQIVVRNGQNLGSRNYFPNVPVDTTDSELLNGFIPQHYSHQPIPPELLFKAKLEEETVILAYLSEKRIGKVEIIHQPRGGRAGLMSMAQDNARHAVKLKMAGKAGVHQRYEALQQALQLDFLPKTMECFDISHTQGKETVASCVVFGPDGAEKKQYRRFNIRDIEPGDDYAAMRQAVSRRYERQLKEGSALPDILLIDGGKGQLNQAVDIFKQLQIHSVLILGVAKGPERKAGEETLIPADTMQAFQLDPSSPALHLIQEIRDEAHRFAIQGHRKKRQKASRYSVLENIEGIGQAKRSALLKHFGGLQGVLAASVDELKQVPGFNQKLAERVLQHIHQLKNG